VPCIAPQTSKLAIGNFPSAAQTPRSFLLAAGLALGGLIAAPFATPFAALMAKHLRAKVLLMLVGELTRRTSLDCACQFLGLIWP
jgi:hypothetical protein